jgi:hypothetical protein
VIDGTYLLYETSPGLNSKPQNFEGWFRQMLSLEIHYSIFDFFKLSSFDQRPSPRLNQASEF